MFSVSDAFCCFLLLPRSKMQALHGILSLSEKKDREKCNFTNSKHKIACIKDEKTKTTNAHTRTGFVSCNQQKQNSH